MCVCVCVYVAAHIKAMCINFNAENIGTNTDNVATIEASERNSCKVGILKCCKKHFDAELILKMF